MENRQRLILIRGLPGSGKSTLARLLTSALLASGPLGEDWEHVEADHYFCRFGKYEFNPEELPSAHLWCQETVKDFLRIGMSVIVSNTFSRVWEMQPYIDFAKSAGVELTVLTCEGNYGNVHGVPDETIQKMKDRWERFD